MGYGERERQTHRRTHTEKYKQKRGHPIRLPPKQSILIHDDRHGKLKNWPKRLCHLITQNISVIRHGAPYNFLQVLTLKTFFFDHFISGNPNYQSPIFSPWS